ncbi:MAG: FAD-dependent oxidoreductase [Candidatus Odinarchaeota archaeon]|nr:FAD-dependent oxidoreductase [Candidatus Odinarchaeota archaeon]
MKFLKCKPDQIPPKVGKSVAIIGAGPAGLTAAGILVCKGYEIHVYDKMPEPGGLLIFGIPAWRIPKEPIRKGIRELEEAGVIFHQGVEVDNGLFEKILSEHDAVLIATGCWSTKKMGLPGEDLEGIYFGLDYAVQEGLARDGYISQDERIIAKGKVGVIGCGATAIDVARQAIRDGAEVYVIYRRTRELAPSPESELKAAEKEGVNFLWLRNPIRFIGENGKLKKVELIKMKLGEPDESGRARPEPISGSEYTMDVDMIFICIGQKPTPPFFKNTYGIELTSKGTIKVDKLGRTTREGVFAAGDVVTGPWLIGPAVKGGINVAKAIDEYLRTGEWKFEE